MSTWKKWAAPLLALALFATACGGDDDTGGTGTATDETETATPTETETTPAAPSPTDTPTEEAVRRADADLVIWADDTRVPVIQPFADQFADEQGITVAVQEVPEDDMRDLVSQNAPAGEGPDIFIGAHDWLGQLVADGVVAPIDLGALADDFLESAVQAVNYEGNTYGLPYAIENIAVVRNVDLVPEPVGTLEEMVDMGLAMQQAGDVEVPLAWQQPDVYHNYWVVTAEGGYVFGRGADGAYQADDVGIDSDGAIEAASVFGDLADRGALSADLSYDVMIESFANGNAPFAITGPWALASFGDVNYSVDPLPTVAGGQPAPFVGVQTFYVSAFAENELAAKTFVLDFMATEDAQLELYRVGNRPPALRSAFEAASADAATAAFGEAGANGYPMPAIPAMGSVWDAWSNAYTLILQGEAAPAEAFQQAAEQVRNLIAEG